jgi:hypothetical protein
MQKDYLKRTSENNPDSGVKISKHPHAHRHTYLPSRAGTAGSIKDNSGAEVTSDRVILYIHGKLISLLSFGSLAQDVQVEPTSSHRSTLTDTKSSVMLEKQELGLSHLHTV